MPAMGQNEAAVNPQLCVRVAGFVKGWLKAGEEYSWHLERYPICNHHFRGVSLVLGGSFLLLTFGRSFALAQE